LPYLVSGGEFGRTPGAQGNDGRDHNAEDTGMQRRYGDGQKEFSIWMAGGGVKGGPRYGATDEHGIAAVKDPMHINDLHATMLYLIGLDHEKLTYRYSSRDFRLCAQPAAVVDLPLVNGRVEPGPLG
jgi:hypothetical protein